MQTCRRSLSGGTVPSSHTHPAVYTRPLWMHAEDILASGSIHCIAPLPAMLTVLRVRPLRIDDVRARGRTNEFTKAVEEPAQAANPTKNTGRMQCFKTCIEAFSSRSYTGEFAKKGGRRLPGCVPVQKMSLKCVTIAGFLVTSPYLRRYKLFSLAPALSREHCPTSFLDSSQFYDTAHLLSRLRSFLKDDPSDQAPSRLFRAKSLPPFGQLRELQEPTRNIHF